MATYVNNLRLTELDTGEGSGTWGTTTNTSLELIGEALGYDTQDCFTTDADATTTVANGETDPARAMYFKVTSSASLTATRTLTIGPNTVSRVMFIENATTGSQSINISQGSGANVTISNAQTKIIYLDGAGATAAVVDVNSNLISDTLSSVLGSGNTSGGNNMQMTTTDEIQFRDTALKISSSTDGQLDIDADTELEITAPTVDLNGALDVSGDLTVDTDTFFVDVSANAVGIGEASPQQELHITSANPAVRMEDSDGTDAFGDFGFNGSAILIDARNGSSDGAILFRGLGGGTATEYARFNPNGNLGLGVSSPQTLLHLGTAGPQIRFDDTDANGICQIFQGTNVLYIRVDPNEADANSQLRFEVDNAEKLRIDDGKVSFYCGSEIEHTAVTSSSNAATIDLDDGDSFTHDLTENVTYTFSNSAPSGKATAFILKVIQDSTARTITWPTSVDWSGGTAPTLSTGNNDVDIFVFYTNDGGTTYYGSIVGQDFA